MSGRRLRDASDLLADADVIDLHLDTFIPVRLLGFDPLRRHGRGPLGGRLTGHADLPRLEQGGVTGTMWSVTTWPFRTSAGRFRAWKRNARRVRQLVARSGGRLALVAGHGDYLEARRRGALACMLAIQGGHALTGAPADDPLGDPALLRVTLVHLTSSAVGATSSPLRLLGRRGGLTARGRELVRRLDAGRVFLDLAHADRRTFWEALEAHVAPHPVLVTHTGVSGVRPHWRNLEDDQLRAVAATGGVVGIMFHAGFLRRRAGPRDARMVLEHLEHAVEVAGEDHVGVGTDYDGAITPPGELRSSDVAWPRLVAHMLERGWPEPRIRKVLGSGFLRALRALRP